MERQQTEEGQVARPSTCISWHTETNHDFFTITNPWTTTRSFLR